MKEMYQELYPKIPAYLSMVVTVVDADGIYTEFLDDLEEKSEENAEDEDPDMHVQLFEQAGRNASIGRGYDRGGMISKLQDCLA